LLAASGRRLCLPLFQPMPVRRLRER